MDVLKFIDKNLGSYKTVGEEVKVKTCPFCNSKGKSNEYTFNININTGLYRCHRGKCNATGNMRSLENHIFGEVKKKHEPMQIETIKKPLPLSDKVLNYIKGRGISEDCMRYCKIAQTDSGQIIFPHYKNGIEVCQKIRGLDKTFGMSGNTGEISLWMINKASTENPLIITEGEFDAMALITAGVQNVTSLPSGSKNFKWIDKEWEFLEKLEKIIFWGDNDKPGIECRDELISRLGMDRCFYVESKHKDANDCLIAEGVKSVKEHLQKSKRPEIKGFVKGATLKPINWLDMPKFELNIGGINNALGGGLPMGYYTVLSGKRGSGKTTLVNNIAVAAMRNDFPVFYYSGEMEAAFVMEEIYRIIGGTENVKDSRPLPHIKKHFSDRYSDYLIINEKPIVFTEHQLMKTFENAIRRYGCKVLILDNLMKVRFENCFGLHQLLERQDIFCQDLSDLCQKYKVHIVIVQHPAKVADRKMCIDDIRGSGRITDTAANVIITHRIDDSFLSKNKDYEDSSFSMFNGMVSIEKNRFGGVETEEGVNFCPISRRFWTVPFENKRAFLELDLPF